MLEQAQATREDIANLEAQAGAARKKIERGDGFITKFISSGIRPISEPRWRILNCV